MGKSVFFLGLVTVLGALHSVSEETMEAFDAPPSWEGKNYAFPVDQVVEKTFDFGYRSTNHAGGKMAGEIGGTLWRSQTPAYYARSIRPETLKKRLSCSGTFSVTESHGGGVLFGWFNTDSRGWRTPNSLVMRLQGEQDGFRVFFEYGTQYGETGGGTTFEGGRDQTTRTPLFRADGTPHVFSLTYNPNGALGLGEIVFVLDEEVFRVPLAPGHKGSGAVFDRFGLLNQQTSGPQLDVWFDDIFCNGTLTTFDEDPEWEGLNNTLAFADKVLRPFHDVGYRATNRAGGTAGEIGGTVWCIDPAESEKSLVYGVPIKPLDLNHPLTASGLISMETASVDSGLYIGWYNHTSKPGAPPQPFLGAMLEGPSRAGHYYRSAFRNASGEHEVLREGPVLRADRESHQWTIHYDPDANNGLGKIVTSLDGVESVMPLPEGMKDGATTFDRFGILSINQGGLCVEVYVDDITYTSGP